jgi:hypothetical protein
MALILEVESSKLLLRPRISPAGIDALHVVIAEVNAMDYLLTWNCTHINNAEILTKLERACSNSGYRCPVICMPE